MKQVFVEQETDDPLRFVLLSTHRPIARQIRAIMNSVELFTDLTVCGFSSIDPMISTACHVFNCST